eukprot:gene22718-27264_t
MPSFPMVAVMAMAMVPAAVSAAPAVPTIPMWTPNGTYPLPVVGLGTAFGWNDPARVTAYNATKLWLQNGGRAVHAAWMYCNQAEVGQAIRDSGIPRSELFIMSMFPQWTMGYNETKANFEDTLKQLQVDYLDLYMFHWPGVFMDQIPLLPPKHFETCNTRVTEVPPCKVGHWTWSNCRLESYRAINDLQQEGKIRATGVSNFEIPHLK